MIQRNHIDNLHESKKTIEESTPQDLCVTRSVKIVSKAIDIEHEVTRVVDKAQEVNKYK